MMDFTDRLLPGERILWTGRPVRGLRLSKRDALLIPFSVAWCGFVVAWEFGVAQAEAPGFLRLWGGLFLAFGLFLAVGRFFLDAWLRDHIAYALTTQRLLVIRQSPLAEFDAVGPARLGEARLIEQPDGSGTIRVGPDLPVFTHRWGAGAGLGMWVPALDPTPQLIGVPNARQVFDQMQQLAAGALR